MEDQYQMDETVDGSSIRNLFAKNLKRLRENARMSQFDLAALTDRAPNFINDIEHEKKFVSEKTIAKLAMALKVEPHEFFLPEEKWDIPDEYTFVENFSTYIGMMVKEHSSNYLKDIFRKEPEKKE